MATTEQYLTAEVRARPDVPGALPACRRSWAKRAMDVAGALVLLAVLSPVIAVIALVIKLRDPGPVLFAWELIGADGRPVRSYKFRTMIPHAEALEKPLRARGENEMASVYFKLRHDPRVTPVGRFLRRHSLDELPSLWSVLKGDLSLVGPRPVRVAEREYLRPWHLQRFAAKPGLTSPWVVGGKNAIRDFDRIVESDLDYIRHWSLGRDLRILAQTAAYLAVGRNY